MTTTPERKNTGAKIERLERAVRALQRRSTLSSASISGGNLTVRDGGNIRVIDGGNIIGEGGGDLDWAGDAHFGGELDVDGNTNIDGPLDIGGTTHIGGNLTIDGDTLLGGNLEFAPGVIPPEALSRRTEARTVANTGGSTPNTANSFTLDTVVPIPDWAETVSCTVTGTVHIVSADSIFTMTAITTIAGDAGTETGGTASQGNLSTPTVHGRDFAASGTSFTVNVRGGLQGITASGVISVATVVTAIFTN